MDEKPTTKQIARIASWQLPTPATKNECTNLLDFILNGNGSRGVTVRERVRLARRYHHDWLHMNVRLLKQARRYRSTNGTVIALHTRTAAEVERARLTCHDRDPHPFVALVQLEPHHNQARLSFSNLHITGTNKQLRLFQP